MDLLLAVLDASKDWESAPEDDRVARVIEEIRADPVKAFTIDQAQGTGMWQKLGEFDLAPGAVLRIVPAKSHGTVIADGFALAPLP